MGITLNPHPLLDYMSMAPLPLAFERSLEAQIFSTLELERPVLDIGCGEGLFAKMVFAEALDTGIDPDSRELERAAELGAYRELIECPGDAIPKPDGSYQTVIANSVLEHIPDIEPVLRESLRLLASGGHMYITVPSDKFEIFSVGHRLLSGLGLRGPAKRYRSFYNSFWNHYHCYAPDEWARLATDCGFELTEQFTYDPALLCFVNDLLVPLSLPGLILKRTINRWTMAPSIRRALFYPINQATKGSLERAVPAEDGGLVFMALRKPR